MTHEDGTSTIAQRALAALAVIMAAMLLIYSGLVAGLMATPVNARLALTISLLAITLVANSALLLGPPRSARHSLRIVSHGSLVVLICALVAVTLHVIRSGR